MLIIVTSYYEYLLIGFFIVKFLLYGVYALAHTF